MGRRPAHSLIDTRRQSIARRSRQLEPTVERSGQLCRWRWSCCRKEKPRVLCLKIAELSTVCSIAVPYVPNVCAHSSSFYPTNHLIGEIVGPLSNSSSSTARRSSRAAHARPSSQSLPRVPATRVPAVSPPNTGEAGPAACCVLRSNFCGLQVLPESCASALNSSSPVFALPTDVESDPLCVRRTASELAAKSCLSWCSLNCLSARTCAVSRCSALASCAACFSARSLASSAALRLCSHRRKTSVSSHHQYVLCPLVPSTIYR